MQNHAAPGRSCAVGSSFRGLLTGTRGATAIEFGLIVALIALAIGAALTALGLDLVGVFTAFGDYIPSASETTGPDSTIPNVPAEPEPEGPVRLNRP